MKLSRPTFYYDNRNWLADIRQLHCTRREFSKSSIRNARLKLALSPLDPNIDIATQALDVSRSVTRLRHAYQGTAHDNWMPPEIANQRSIRSKRP